MEVSTLCKGNQWNSPLSPPHKNPYLPPPPPPPMHKHCFHFHFSWDDMPPKMKKLFCKIWGGGGGGAGCEQDVSRIMGNVNKAV